MQLYIYSNHRPYNSRVNHKASYGLWVIMVCQCRFILVKKRKSTVWGVMLIMEEVVLVWGQGAHGRISDSCLSNSVINLRQLLKNKNFNKRLIKGGNSLRRLGNLLTEWRSKGSLCGLVGTWERKWEKNMHGLETQVSARGEGRNVQGVNVWVYCWNISQATKPLYRDIQIAKLSPHLHHSTTCSF